MTDLHVPEKIEHLPIDAVLPYARNSRTHSDAQVAAVASSIKEFGFTNPVLIRDDGTIVAGHGRVLAARHLGLKSVPCIRLGYLTEAQARAYVIADNKLAELAGWDDDLLAIELRELKDEGFDLGLTGFSDDELNELLFVEPVAQADADTAPAVQSVAVSQPGDLWILGDHRLMCGDSTNAAQVQQLLGGGVPHLMVTDPPYGVEYDPTRTSDNPLKAGQVRSEEHTSELQSPSNISYAVLCLKKKN
jgi:ParB-like chromosome segregation protein Spo0J